MEKLMTADDVANFLGVTRMTVYQLKSRHEIPFLKVGGSLRFEKNAIEKWVEAQMTSSKGE